MNWEAIGAVGEILGALAVVVTLAYLAVQVRHAREEAAHSARQKRDDGVREAALAMARDQELSSAWWKANDLLALDTVTGSQRALRELGLEASEANSVNALCIYWAWIHSTHFTSAMTERDRENFERLIREFYPNSPMKVFWGSRQPDQFDKEFESYVDRVLAEAEAQRTGPPSGAAVPSA